MHLIQILLIWTLLGAALIGYATSSSRGAGSPALVTFWLVAAGPAGWRSLALVWILPHFVDSHIPDSVRHQRS